MQTTESMIYSSKPVAISRLNNPFYPTILTQIVVSVSYDDIPYSEQLLQLIECRNNMHMFS